MIPRSAGLPGLEKPKRKNFESQEVLRKSAYKVHQEKPGGWVNTKKTTMTGENEEKYG